MRTDPPHIFAFIGGKYGLYGYCMLLQTGKVRNYQDTDQGNVCNFQNAYQGNQVQLTYILSLISKLSKKSIAIECHGVVQREKHGDVRHT